MDGGVDGYIKGGEKGRERRMDGKKNIDGIKNRKRESEAKVNNDRAKNKPGKKKSKILK